MDRDPSPSPVISQADEAMSFTLSEARLDLWFIWPDWIDDEAELAYCTSIITEEEYRQIGRFVLPRDQRIRLVTRASARAVLGRYLGLAPRDLRFERGAFGKPDLIAPQRAASNIAFNISHTNGLILLGVTCGRAVGVDVESLECESLLSFVDQFMTEAELHAARRLDAVAQHRRHLEIWTLKEAYSKARSIGLSLPMREMAFNVDDPTQAVFSATGVLAGEAGRWEFMRFALENRYVGVVCSAVREGVSPSVTAASVTPLLRDIEPVKLEGLGAVARIR